LPEGTRRLAAIMFTDMVGYTALTQSSETLAMEVLEKHYTLLRPFFPKFHGREVKTIGDSFLVEFENVLDAVKCAIELQSFLHDYNLSSTENWKTKLRIGIHLGDVIHQGGDVFGDAVNIASRVEPLAEPEGICLTEQVYDQVHNKVGLPLISHGERPLKNVGKPIGVYAVQMPWQSQPHSSELDEHRIAILPFANMSPDPNDAYFADGITEEIISTVANIGGLSVISRTSVMGYKGTTKKVREIGEELEVGSVLEGSLRKAGNKIRVTAQLIAVSGDRHVWAQSYDRNLDDVFAVQTDIAKKVADSLRVKILSPEMKRIGKKPTQNTTAYTLYLRGRYLWNKRNLDDVKKAAEYFEQATKEDPAFALGYLGLADSFLILRNNYGLDVAVNHQKAKTMLAKAMELDPELAEAHATTGLSLVDDYRLRDAEGKFKKAIELKPSYAFAHMWYYNTLVDQLRWDEALDQIEKASELDPLSPVINNNYAYYYFVKGENDRALEMCQRVVELDPSYLDIYPTMAWIFRKMNRFDDADHAIKKFVDGYQASFPFIGKAAETYGAYIRDEKETVRRLLPELAAHLGDSRTEANEVAGYYFYLGEVDKGFDWLERSYSRREYGLLGIKHAFSRFFPLFDQIPRSDPRYLDLVERLGLEYEQPT